MPDTAASLQVIQAGDPRNRRALNAMAISLTLLTLGLLSWLISVERAPGPAAVVLFVVLGAIASHRETIFGDETAMTGSLIVVVAAVIAFPDSPLVPCLSALAGGLQWGHLRARAWIRIAVNSAATVLPAALASALATLVGPADTPSLSILLLVVLVYWIANNVIVGVALAIAEGGPPRPSIANLIRSETEMLVFALLGSLCGLLVLEVGLWAGAVGLVATLAAVDVLVIGRPRIATVRMRHPGLGARAAQGLALLAAGGTSYGIEGWTGPFLAGTAGTATGLVVTLAAVALAFRVRSGAPNLRVAVGVTAADAWQVTLAAIVGAMAATADPLAAFAVGAVGVALVIVVRKRRRDHAVESPPIDDIEALALLELALADRRGDPRIG